VIFAHGRTGLVRKERDSWRRTSSPPAWRRTRYTGRAMVAGPRRIWPVVVSNSRPCQRRSYPQRITTDTDRLATLALPAIEVIAAGALASTDNEANKPGHKKDNGDYPQDVQGETKPEEQQHQQQSHQDQHPKSFRSE
jgi:hypothetical protein